MVGGNLPSPTGRQTILGGLCVSPLQTALEDFYLSRRAMRCTGSTLDHYRYTAGVFVTWLQRRSILDPKSITAAHVREWLAEDVDRLKDTCLHARARGVRTFLRFLHAEGYVPEVIRFPMPKLEHKRLPCLDANDVRMLLAGCSAKQRAL